MFREPLYDVGIAIYINSMKRVLLFRAIDLDQRIENEQQAFEMLSRCIHGEGICSSIHVEFRDLLKELSRYMKLFVLLEYGRPIELRDIQSKSVFVLGAEVDPPKDIVSELNLEVISIGPKSYLASHVVAYINWLYARKKSSLAS